jgi:hypothetical protein
MEISSLSSTAIQGLQNSQNQLTRSAINIAGKEAQEGKTEVTQDLVEMKDASHSFNASAKMVKAEADVMGTLLDIKA